MSVFGLKMGHFNHILESYFGFLVSNFRNSPISDFKRIFETLYGTHGPNGCKHIVQPSTIAAKALR